jgi:hypothetical protein
MTLTNASMADKLAALLRRERAHIAMDTRYDLRGWHANDATIVAQDAQVGMCLCPSTPS